MIDPKVAQYCAEAEAFMLGEMRQAAGWVREGVATILAPAELRVLTGT